MRALCGKNSRGIGVSRDVLITARFVGSLGERALVEPGARPVWSHRVGAWRARRRAGSVGDPPTQPHGGPMSTRWGSGTQRDAVLGPVVAERRQHLDALGDRGERREPVGPRGPVVGLQRVDRLHCQVAVLSLWIWASADFAPGCTDFGRAATTLELTWNQHRCSSVSGNTSGTAFSNPNTPSPTATTGVRPSRAGARTAAAPPRTGWTRETDRQQPPVPWCSSARTPIITSRHTRTPWVKCGIRWLG